MCETDTHLTRICFRKAELALLPGGWQTKECHETDIRGLRWVSWQRSGDFPWNRVTKPKKQVSHRFRDKPDRGRIRPESTWIAICHADLVRRSICSMARRTICSSGWFTGISNKSRMSFWCARQTHIWLEYALERQSWHYYQGADGRRNVTKPIFGDWDGFRDSVWEIFLEIVSRNRRNRSPIGFVTNLTEAWSDRSRPDHGTTQPQARIRPSAQESTPSAVSSLTKQPANCCISEIKSLYLHPLLECDPVAHHQKTRIGSVAQLDRATAF